MNKENLKQLKMISTGVEKRLEEIAIELNNTGSNFEKAQELMNEEVELNEKLEHMMERWTYLTEIVRGITVLKSMFMICFRNMDRIN